MILRPLLIVAVACFVAVSASASPKDEIWDLSKEKSKLTREVSSLFRKQKIKDKDLDELGNKAFGAAMSFAKARKDHPDLKELNKKNEETQNKMVRLMSATDKDDAAIKVARDEYVEAQKALVAKSGKIPEIVELQNKAMAANQAVKDKKNELLAATPEGKILFDKIKALDVKIEALRKQLK